MEMLNTISLIASFLMGSVFLYLAIQRWEKTQLVRNTPTETLDAHASGRTEIQGTVEALDDVIDEPFSDGQCVYAQYKVEEYNRSSSQSQNSGRNQRWQTLFHDEIVVPFAINDGSDRAYINFDDEPEFKISDVNRTQLSVGSREEEPEAVKQFLEYNNMAPKQSGLTGMLAGKRRKYLQTVLPVGEDVYVYGRARPDDNGNTVFSRDPETDEFFISDKDADSLATTLNRQTIALAVLGVSFFFMGFYFLIFGL